MSAPVEGERTAALHRTDRGQRKAELSRRLLGAMERLVGEGEIFPSSSIARLTSAAGAGRSTFYFYFKDKTELLQSWFAPIAKELSELDSVWARLDATTEREDLRKGFEDLVEVFRRHGLALSIVLDATAYDPVIRRDVHESLSRSVAALAEQIERGQQGGWINGSLLARETATWLTMMRTRGAQDIARIGDRASTAGLMDSYTDLVYRAFFDPAAGRAP
jgi:TetR/AcrR family transcriptional regulator, ethionamide resistance regulator